MTAIIPAAGLGTRFLPATRVVPKEMLPIGSRPALDWIVEEARSAGATRIVLVISRAKELVRRYFEDSPDVAFAYQEEQRGLGHAVLQAKGACEADGPLLILLGDALVLGCNAAKEMADLSRANGGAAVIGCEHVPPEKVSRYGILKVVDSSRRGETPRLQDKALDIPSSSGRGETPRLQDDHPCPPPPLFSTSTIVDLVEKPSLAEAPSDLAIAGRYLLPPAVFGYLATQTPGKGGEIQLTDAIRRMIADGRTTCLAYPYPGRRQDIGNPEGYFKALEYFYAHR